MHILKVVRGYYTLMCVSKISKGDLIYSETQDEILKADGELWEFDNPEKKYPKVVASDNPSHNLHKIRYSDDVIKEHGLLDLHALAEHHCRHVAKHYGGYHSYISGFKKALSLIHSPSGDSYVEFCRWPTDRKFEVELEMTERNVYVADKNIKFKGEWNIVTVPDISLGKYITVKKMVQVLEVPNV
jgi:hypothetical protein